METLKPRVAGPDCRNPNQFNQKQSKNSQFIPEQVSQSAASASISNTLKMTAVWLLALLVAGGQGPAAAAAVGLPASPADDLNHRTAASAGPTTSLELKHTSPDITSSEPFPLAEELVLAMLLAIVCAVVLLVAPHAWPVLPRTLPAQPTCIGCIRLWSGTGLWGGTSMGCEAHAHGGGSSSATPLLGPAEQEAAEAEARLMIERHELRRSAGWSLFSIATDLDLSHGLGAGGGVRALVSP